MVYIADNTFGYMSTTTVETIAEAVRAFRSLPVDDQLGLFWFIYTELGASITPAVPGAARLQLAEGLLEQIRAMTYAEQLDTMRDLVACRNTALTRAYGVLSENTKLAFWYQLAEWMTRGTVIPAPADYQISEAARRVFATLSAQSFGVQITILREIVRDMGVDPLAAR